MTSASTFCEEKKLAISNHDVLYKESWLDDALKEEALCTGSAVHGMWHTYVEWVGPSYKMDEYECKKMFQIKNRNVGGVTSEVLCYCCSNFVVVLLISNIWLRMYVNCTPHNREMHTLWWEYSTFDHRVLCRMTGSALWQPTCKAQYQEVYPYRVVSRDYEN
jgi:hypothetical protein